MFIISASNDESSVTRQVKSRPRLIRHLRTRERYQMQYTSWWFPIPHVRNRNSSGDETANVNFLMTISHTYLKMTKKRTNFIQQI